MAHPETPVVEPPQYWAVGLAELVERGERAPSSTVAELLIDGLQLSPPDADALRSASVQGVGRDRPQLPAHLGAELQAAADGIDTRPAGVTVADLDGLATGRRYLTSDHAAAVISLLGLDASDPSLAVALRCHAVPSSKESR